MSLSFFLYFIPPTWALTHALNGREPLAPSESLLEHTNRIFRVARLHKRQDSPTSRQRPERYTCRFWAHLFPIINELPIRKIKEKSLCSWNLDGCAPPIESIKCNCSRDVVIYVLYLRWHWWGLNYVKLLKILMKRQTKNNDKIIKIVWNSASCDRLERVGNILRVSRIFEMISFSLAA